MQTASDANPASIQRITYGGKTYSLRYQQLVEIFDVLGKPPLLCELDACPETELVPSDGKVYFNQRCVYKPTNELTWMAAEPGAGFVPDNKRCVSVDERLREYIRAGILDDYKVN